MLNVAMIGCGMHAASAHATPLARYARVHPGALRLVAACDLDPVRARGFCERFGFERAFDSLYALLASGTAIDECVCVVPVAQIARLSAMLLDRRIPCVIEKPLGATLAEAQELAAAARRTGT